MTDSEIVKALECCGTTKGCCHDCPLNDDNVDILCQDELVTEAYKLINRQQAEIEKAKSEAVKEFAKFLIDKSDNGVIFIPDIPDFVKEIVGEV